MSILKHNLSNTSKLFELLQKEPPLWWNKIKYDPRLYIEIRKNNSINVYYEGGSIARVSFDRKTKEIMAVAHAKYMSKTGNKYLDCRQYITDHLEDMLHQVETCYSNKSSKSCSIEDISEKKIQGDMIIANRELYLDSEFQHLHQVIDKKNISIRIDLIKVIHNEIVFVELKRISDNRLLCTDKGATPEIINQMEMYSSFIGEHKEELLKYYILLYNIKKELGLPIPNLDIDKLTINTIPELLIINTYVKESARRSNRIKNLKQLLDKNHIKYSIKSI